VKNNCIIQLKFAPIATPLILLIMSGMILTTIIMVINVTWIDSAYGQNPPIPSIPNGMIGTVTKQPLSASQSSSTTHGVRITSPIKGQHVPIGVLTIAGTSKDNAISDCHVDVIVNGIKPYQNASATGPNGDNDYSKWNFTLTPKYTLIKQGVNKITAKFSCNPNPTIASFYSVNVTGVGVSSTTATKQQLSTAITGNSTPARANSTITANSSKFPFGPS
jgi:hypothetical protein